MNGPGTSKSEHQTLYKNNGVGIKATLRRKAAAIEIRKQKQDELIQERRARTLGSSDHCFEGALGQATISGISSNVRSEQEKALSAILDQMRSSTMPLGPVLYRSGLLSNVAQLYSVSSSSVDSIIGNLHHSGAQFVEGITRSQAMGDLVNLLCEAIHAWTVTTNGNSAQSSLDHQNLSLDQILYALGYLTEASTEDNDALFTESFCECLCNFLHLIPYISPSEEDVSLLRGAVWLASLIIRRAPVHAFTYLLLSKVTEKMWTAADKKDSLKDFCDVIEECLDVPEYHDVLLKECLPSLLTMLPTLGGGFYTLALHTIIACLESNADFIKESAIPQSMSMLLGCMDLRPNTIPDICYVFACLSSVREGVCAMVNFCPVLSTMRKVLDSGCYAQRKEALLVVRNVAMSFGELAAIPPFIYSCVPSLCDLLTVIDADVVENVLVTLQITLRKEVALSASRMTDMIEENGGLEKIEFLQTSQIFDVSCLAMEIMDEFFDSSEVDAEDELDDGGSGRRRKGDDGGNTLSPSAMDSIFASVLN